MTGWQRYNERLFFWELLVATNEEVDIEAAVWGVADRPNENADDWLADRKQALRVIDQLQITGTYEAERSRLMALRGPDPNIPLAIVATYLSESHESDFEALGNFGLGLRNLDPQERASFRAFLGANPDLRSKPLSDALLTLRLLRRAKRKLGAPMLVPPWSKPTTLADLDHMRLILQGDEDPTAVGQVALKVARAGDSDRRNDHGRRARHIRDYYLKRLSLRQ